MSKEFEQGVNHYNLGKSIHYNPYRHKGTAKQFVDWVSGWKHVQA